MSEVHIFDFDGTLFYSPAPTHSAVTSLFPPPTATTTEDSTTEEEVRRTEESNKLYGSLLNPVDSGGYGWFQSIHTMTPPAVPDVPDPAVWFVAPILAHMRALVRRREELLRGPNAAKAEVPLLYVLTGRDAKYYNRIWTLLQQVGLDQEVEDVILKPYETAGTVAYKLNNFFKLIQYHQPSRVYYYEDRVEQGGRLLEGIRVLEEVLYHNRYGNTAAAERVGVVTFDVKPTPSGIAEAHTHAGALHAPQPEVDFKFAAQAQGSSGHEVSADARLSTLTSTLRASPDALLRDACYPLDRIAAFYANPADATSEKAAKAAEHAERQARRWVEGTIEFWNAKNTPERGRGGRGGGGGRGRGAGNTGKKATKGFDARALHESICFTVAPPFTFLMVLVPAALCERSNYMLDATQFSTLVDRLKAEKEKKASRGPSA